MKTGLSGSLFECYGVDMSLLQCRMTLLQAMAWCACCTDNTCVHDEICWRLHKHIRAVGRNVNRLLHQNEYLLAGQDLDGKKTLRPRGRRSICKYQSQRLSWGQELVGNTTLRQRGHNNMFKYQNEELLMGQELVGQNTLRPRGHRSI